MNPINFNKKLFYTLLFSVIFISCVSDNDFDEPIVNNCEMLNTNTDIQALISWSGDKVQEITEEGILEGFVISEDSEENIYEKFYVVSPDGKYGLQLNTSRAYLFNKYPLGRKIYIKLKGLATIKKNGMTMLGMPSENPDKVGDIPPGLIDNFFIIGCEQKNIQEFEQLVRKTNTVGQPLTLNDLDDSYLNTFIEVHNVEFINAGQPYVRDKKDTVNKLTDSDISLYLNKFAHFAAYIIPSGKVTIRGILINGPTSYYIILNNVNGVIKTAQ